MFNKSLISVLIPAYNAEEYIKESIESIISQTYNNLEIIVIDDGSTDGTWDQIKKLAKTDKRIKPYRNNINLNICNTLNRGLNLCQGEYVVRMDADDWSYPDRIEKQVKYMKKNPKVGVSGGSMEVCDSNMNRLNLRYYNLNDNEIREKIFRYSPFCHPATIWKKEAIMLGYDPNLRDAEDYDLYFRVGMDWQFGNISDVLIKYRTSKKSISLSRSKRQEFLTLKIRLKAVKEYGYKMSLVDYIYSIFQYVSIYVIPYKMKFFIFNKLRSLNI